MQSNAAYNYATSVSYRDRIIAAVRRTTKAIKNRNFFFQMFPGFGTGCLKILDLSNKMSKIFQSEQSVVLFFWMPEYIATPHTNM